LDKPEIRSCLELIKPYQPGKPVDEVERELGLKGVIKMASNENPAGPSSKAVEVMKRHAEKMHVYPDGNCYYLKRATAEKLGVKPEQLVFGNGSDELLSFLTLAYINPGDEAVMVTPSFSEYVFAMRLMGGEIKKVPLEEDTFEYNLDNVLEQVNEKTKLIFLCSPNNPSGTVIKKGELDRFLEKLPEKVLVVMDQAYLEFATDPDHPDGVEYVKKGMPVVALRTFSKIYGLAGLRIGYGVAPEEVAADINRVREPFNVNAMAQAAALEALNDEEHLKKSRQLVNESRKHLTEGFAGLGVKPVPDQANFCFVDIKVDSREAFQALLKQGVIVRTGDIFGFPTYLRITYGTIEQNNKLIEALKNVLNELQ